MEDEEFNEIDEFNESFVTAVEKAREIRDAAEAALAEAVERARWRGHSWAAIASALETSRQGAWERYRPRYSR